MSPHRASLCKRLTSAAYLTAAALLGGAAALFTPCGAWAATPTPTPAGQSQPAVVPIFFTAIVGDPTPTGPPILLRWYAQESIVALPSSVIYRTGPASPRTKLSVLTKIRDIPTIVSLLKAPANSAARAELAATLDRIVGPGSGTSDEELANRLISVLDAPGAEDEAVFRRTMLVQGSYIAAIVQGLGLLDHPDAAPAGQWTYELWMGDAVGEPQSLLAQIKVDPAVPTLLPAPVAAKEVVLKSRFNPAAVSGANHERVYLTWERAADLKAQGPKLFGYHVYRLDRALNAGESFESVRSELQRINDVPILPGPTAIEGEDPAQSYQFADWGAALEGGAPLPVGANYTYWVAARDLFGRDGVASAPVAVTVRDAEPPTSPRGVVVARREPATSGAAPTVELTWDRNADADVASYKLYRYQNYGSIGDPGPLAPVNGIAEGDTGITAAQPPDSSARPTVSDPTPGTNPGVVFWYAVSAVDASGNESSLSAAKPITIDDYSAPVITAPPQVCTTSRSREVAVAASSDRAVITDYWKPEFRAAGVDSGIVTIEIDRRDKFTGERTRIATINRSAGESTANDDMPDVLLVENAPYYSVRFIDALGQVWEVFEAAPDPEWLVGRLAVFTLTSTVNVNSECITATGGSVRVDPDPATGAFNPVEFAVDVPAGTERLRLYRSIEGGDYELVGEISAEESAALRAKSRFKGSGKSAPTRTAAGQINIQDPISLEDSVKALYGVQGVTAGGESGPISFVDAEVFFGGKVPAPTLISAKKAGNSIEPAVTLRWQGKGTGVASFRVWFDGADGSVPPKPLIVPAKQVTYTESNATFSLVVNRADGHGNLIDKSKNYLLRIEALSSAGVLSQKSNAIPFNWLVKDTQSDVFYWPVRGTQGTFPLSTNAALVRILQGDVLVPLGESVVGTGSDPRATMGPLQPPFMVWRRRTDAGSMRWNAVSPLIESVKTVNGATPYELADPFFALQTPPGGSGDLLFYRDRAGLALGASYEYIYLKFHEETRELIYAVGPFSVSLPNVP